MSSRSNLLLKKIVSLRPEVEEEEGGLPFSKGSVEQPCNDMVVLTFMAAGRITENLSLVTGVL